MPQDELYQYQVEAQPVFSEPPPPVPNFDWFVQHPDPPLPLPPHPEGFSALVEFKVAVPEDLDWFVQHPDQTYGLTLNPEPGYFSFVEFSTLIFPPPDFGWFIQEPDVVHPLHQVQTGLSVLVEFNVPVPPPVPAPTNVVSVINQTDVIRGSGKVIGY